MNDIYRTQANVYQDTFSNPINSANMNPGWGMNPALLTPSYEAPYRPQYMGPTGYAAYGNPGFFRGAANILGPSTSPYWGNPIDNIHSSINSVASRPMDALAWAGQNIALPTLAYSGMARMMGTGASGLGLGAMMRGQGIAAGIGHGLGGGAMSMFTANAGARSFASGAGGLMGGLALPLMAGQMAWEGMNQSVIAPYLSARQNAQNLQSNFSNIYFGDGSGNPISGKGLSGRKSHGMGIDLAHKGLNDMMFSRDEYSSIADMSARSGLLDNVKSNQITQRVKDIAEQIKLIVSISKDPDIRTAIEEISKLNLSGASVSGGRYSVASNAYAQLGGYAAQAGTSVQRLMNTVGAQGQYLYQSNGMTPYLGQLAAANSYAGFASAQRSGLISSAQLARMGGIDGATQASQSAQVIGSQTMYNMMGAYNQFVGGMGGQSARTGAGQTTVGTISAFGESVSRDPLKASGAMSLYGRMAAGAAMSKNGSRGLEESAASYLRSMGREPDAGNGKYSPELMAAAMKAFGVPEDQIMGYMHQRMSETDPTTYRQRMDAIHGQGEEQLRQYIDQNIMGQGFFDRSARSLKEFTQGIGGSFAREFADPAARAVGRMADAGSKAAEWWGYSRTLTKGLKVKNSNNLVSSGKVNQSIDLFDIEGSLKDLGDFTGWNDGVSSVWDNDKLTFADSQDFMKKVNELAKAGNEEARAYLSASKSGDAGRTQQALDRLIKKNRGELGRAADLLSANGNSSSMSTHQLNANVSRLNQIVGKTKRGSFSMDSSSDKNKLEKAARATASGSSALTSLLAAGGANDLVSRIHSQGEDSISWQDAIDMVQNDPRYKGILDLAGNDRNKIQSTIESIYRNGSEQGTLQLGSGLFSSGLTQQDAMNKSEIEQQKIIADEVKRNGDWALTSGIKNSATQSLKQLTDANKVNNPLSVSAKQLTDAYLNSSMDTTELRKNISGLDNSTVFGLAVDKFDKAVSRMPGSSSLPAASSVLPGSDNQKTQTAGGGFIDRLSAWSRSH